MRSDGECRQPHRLLRGRRRLARHGAEPYLQVLCLAAMEPPWSLGAGRGARRQDRRAQLPAADDARTTSIKSWSAPSTSPAKCTASEVPGYRQEVRDFFEHAQEADPGRLDHRNLRRPAAVHRQLALGRRAVLPAHRQAAAQARQRGGHSVQGRAADSVQHQPDVPLEPTVLSLRVQPEEGLSLRIASQAAGAEGADLSGEDGVQLQLQLRRHARRKLTNG